MTKITNNLTARIAAGIVAAVMAVSLSFGGFIAPAQANTLNDLLAQITALQAQITALQGGNTNVSTSNPTNYGFSCDYRFTQNLTLESRGTGAMNLQKFLNADASTAVAVVGVGSKGQETSYFGNLSRQAVIKYQLANNITPAVGFFGPLTRSSVNADIAASCSTSTDNGSSNGNSGSTFDGDLEASRGDQPDDMTVGQAQILIPTTVLELRAGDNDVDVMSVTVELTGNGQDAVDEVQAWIDGKIVDTDSVDSDDEAELDLDLEIRDGEMVEVTFTVSMEDDLSDEDGLEFELRVVEVEADGDVEGLPVTGAEHQVRDSLDLNTYDLEIVNEGSEVQVGDDEELLATITVTNTGDTADGVSGDADDESIYVWQLVVEHTGTADLSDLDNVMLVDEDGNEYDADMMGDYLMFDVDGLEIEEGDDMEFELYADIQDGAGDYVLFDLDDDDLEEMFFVADEDDRYLAERTGTAEVNTDAGDRTDILAGDGSASDSSEISDDEIAVGEQDAYFVSFELDIEGEDVTGDVLVSMTIANAGAASASDVELDNIRIMDEDGNVVARSDDETIGTSTPFTYDIDFDDITLEEGDDQVFFIVADVSDDVLDGTTYTTTDIDFDNFEGETSGDNADELNDETINPNTVQTVEGAVLVAGVDSSLEDDETKGDADDVEIAVVQLDATASGEDVEVTEITLDFTLTNATSTAPRTDDLSNCALWDDGEMVSDEEDLDGTGLTETQAFDMDSGFMVEKDTVKTLSLRCDLSSDFDTEDTIVVIVNETTANTVANVDAESENENNITVSLIDGGAGNVGATIEIVEATITVSEDAEPDMQTARAGDTVTLGFVEIDNEDVQGEVEKLGLTVTNRAALSSNRKVSIYQDDELVGEAFFTTDNVTVDFDGFELEADKSTVLEFRAELTSNVTSEGINVAVDVNSGVAMRVDGDDYTVAATDFSGVNVYSGLPTFVVASLTDEDIQDNIVMKFAISAVGEDIQLNGATTTLAILTTGSASFASGTETLYTGGSYSDAADESDEVTALVTISEGSTEYFVVKADAVSEGETGDILETTVGLDGAITVEGSVITPIEGSKVNNDEELTYKYTN